MLSLYLILWTGFGIVSVYLFITLVKFIRYRYILGKIPNPKGHWLLRNLTVILGQDPDVLFGLLRKYATELWPIYRFDGVYITTINLLHPSDIEIVLSNMKHLSKSRIYNLLTDWLGEGLLTSTGQKWQTRRKILTPAFHFNILQKFLKIFNEETEKMVKQIDNCCSQPSVDVAPLITQMALQSISEAAMGLDNIDQQTQTEYKQSIYKMGKFLFVKLSRPWYRIPAVYYFADQRKDEVAVTKYLHDFAYRVIRFRESKLLKEYESGELEKNTSYSGRKTVRMLDLLLLNKMEGNNIDLEGIREEVDTFMFEGHDTTSMALIFLFLSLASHPEIQERVTQEIDDVLGSKEPTYNDLQDLRYTEMVIKETLRLYPSVPFISRVASEAFTTHTGYFLPKGTILHLHIFDLHRDPRLYPDPLKFDPDRFLPENTQDRHPFAYIPFSAGPRNCIGQRFAILELKSVLCGVLRKFKLHEVTKPSEVQFMPDLVLRPKTKIRIKFTKK